MSMTLISTTTVGAGGAASIDFTSIPGTYTDLVIQFSTRNAVSGAGDNLNIAFNGSTTSFSYRSLSGSGSSVGNSAGSTNIAGVQESNTATANTFSNGTIYIPNYSGSTNKTFSSDTVTENNATLAYIYILAGLWSNTAAITSISLSGGGNFLQYSTVSLYGITKGSGGATVS